MSNGIRRPYAVLVEWPCGYVEFWDGSGMGLSIAQAAHVVQQMRAMGAIASFDTVGMVLRMWSAKNLGRRLEDV